MKDYLQFALQSIKHRKLRSWMTILAIVIGIAAIVSLVSISQGLENAITEQFENLGSNKLFIMPKGTGLAFSLDSQELTEEDLDTLRGMSEADYVYGYLYGKLEVVFNKDDFYTGVIGLETDQDPADVYEGEGLTLSSGRWPRKNEKGVTVLGSSIALDGFDKEVVVNNKIEVGDEKYEVIGVANPVGNEEDDNNIYLDIEDARIAHDEDTGLTFLAFVAQEDLDLLEVAEKVQRTLERARDEDDFEIFVPEQILEQMGNILDVLQVVLAGIAGISLFVGGIGIMNSMFTNVLERKKEIGIMKSIGASPKDIRNIFLVEAGLIGLVGGILGALVGVFISLAVGEAALAAGFILLDIQIEYPIIIFGVLFAFLVGMFSGYLPAREASKLLPVEALRE